MIEKRPSVYFSALLAAVIFYGLFWITRFPYLADDYYYAWKAYLPGYGLGTFVNLMTRRPLATLLNYFEYSHHIFELTSILFPLYFFLHSLGLILIFRFLLKRWFPQQMALSGIWQVALEVLLCLYPDLFVKCFL